MVLLVTVHLGVVCFFFLHFFASVLGGVTVTAEEGLVVAESWDVPPPFGALTESPPQVGRVAAEVGRRGELCGLVPGGLATAGRPFARWLRMR